MKEFLEASEAKLQEVFDTSCGFWNSQSVLMERNAGVIKNVSSMKRSADMLMTSSPMLEASPAGISHTVILYALASTLLSGKGR